jgi:DNA-binding NarL/FixJ family response regulator
MVTPPGPSLRILLLEDDPLDADLLIAVLNRAHPGSEIVRVDGAVAFRRALEAGEPDIILSDHGTTDLSALDALRLTQRLRPGAPFFVVSGRFEQTASASLKSGAADFVRKDDLARLAPAITLALKQRAPLRRLSERQLEVLQLLASGSSMRAIAERLDLSVKTVETHRAEVMKRLGIHDLAGLVRYAVRVGIISAME